MYICMYIDFAFSQEWKVNLYNAFSVRNRSCIHVDLYLFSDELKVDSYERHSYAPQLKGTF